MIWRCSHWHQIDITREESFTCNLHLLILNYSQFLCESICQIPLMVEVWLDWMMTDGCSPPVTDGTVVCAQFYTWRGLKMAVVRFNANFSETHWCNTIRCFVLFVFFRIGRTVVCNTLHYIYTTLNTGHISTDASWSGCFGQHTTKTSKAVSSAYNVTYINPTKQLMQIGWWNPNTQNLIWTLKQLYCRRSELSNKYDILAV